MDILEFVRKMIRQFNFEKAFLHTSVNLMFLGNPRIFDSGFSAGNIGLFHFFVGECFLREILTIFHRFTESWKDFSEGCGDA